MYSVYGVHEVYFPDNMISFDDVPVGKLVTMFIAPNEHYALGVFESIARAYSKDYASGCDVTDMVLSNPNGTYIAILRNGELEDMTY